MKLAFVTPRYGADIGAGPEHACRLLAERISERHGVDVLTTCARDARTWNNDYSEGSDRVRGVLVRRFAVGAPPNSPQEAGSPSVRPTELAWLHREGPWAPGLIDYLKRQHRAYDAVVFFSLPNPLTAYGLPIAGERSVVFPYARLQPELRMGLWRDLASAAGAIGFFSDAERHLLRRFVGVTAAREEVVGIGVDPPHRQAYPRHQQDPADSLDGDADPVTDDDVEETAHLSAPGIPFRRRHRLYGRLAFFAGRVEPNHGCEELFEYFDTYAGGDTETALVLMGVKLMKVPEESYLRMPGVLPDAERMAAYEAADVVIAPVPDDLLAQPVLESFAVGTPVLASARNPAAVEHCRRGNAGLYYGSREEFVEALRLILEDSRLRAGLAENGRTYVRQQYRWEAVLGRFERLIGSLRA